jgi:hypothetical protein
VENHTVVSQLATSAFGVPIGRMSNLSDEDVIERIRQGHTDALSILFDRFYRLVLRIALLLSGKLVPKLRVFGIVFAASASAFASIVIA